MNEELTLDDIRVGEHLEVTDSGAGVDAFHQVGDIVIVKNIRSYIETTEGFFIRPDQVKKLN